MSTGSGTKIIIEISDAAKAAVTTEASAGRRCGTSHAISSRRRLASAGNHPLIGRGTIKGFNEAQL